MGHSFLKIGVTWASFSLSGKQLFPIDKFTRAVSWGAIQDLQFFAIFAGIPSAPVAFLMFILFKMLSTFSIVILLNSKSGTYSLLFNISLILGWFEESDPPLI